MGSPLEDLVLEGSRPSKDLPPTFDLYSAASAAGFDPRYLLRVVEGIQPLALAVAVRIVGVINKAIADRLGIEFTEVERRSKLTYEDANRIGIRLTDLLQAAGTTTDLPATRELVEPRPAPVVSYRDFAAIRSIPARTSIAGRALANPPLFATFDVDLATLSLTHIAVQGGSGAGTDFEALTGLRFVRASAGHSVQRAADAVETTASVALLGSNDVARFGGFVPGCGLALEETRTNDCIHSRDVSLAPNPGGGGWTVTTGAASPDGTANGCFLAGNANYTPYWGPFSGWRVGSIWLNGGDPNGPYGMQLQSSGSVSGTTPFDSWAKIDNSTNDATAYVTPGNNLGAGPYAYYVDLVQDETGKFPTSSIITAGAAVTRAPEGLYHPSPATLASGGRLSFEAALHPLGAFAEYQGALIYLWYEDANNQAYINGTGNVVVWIAGVSVTTTGAIAAWARGDRLEIFTAAGGGVLATDVQYRINGGTTVKMAVSSSTPQGTVSTASPLYFLSTSALTAQFSAWIRRIRTWSAGGGPTWLV